MAVLSTYRNIYKQDYPVNFQPAIETLSITLNQSFTELYQALKGNLTFTDNITSTIATITTSVDKNGIPNTKTAFKLKSPQTSVQGIIVINVAGTTRPLSGVYVAFTVAQGIATITNIQGLAVGASYSLTLLAI